MKSYPSYLAVSQADHKGAALERMLTSLSHQHNGRMSFPLLGCFSQVLITILLHSPTSLKRFYSSHAVYLEDLRWLTAAKSPEKGEEEDFTFNSAPGSLQEAGLWEATGHSPAACPAALCGTRGGLQ